MEDLWKQMTEGVITARNLDLCIQKVWNPYYAIYLRLHRCMLHRSRGAARRQLQGLIVPILPGIDT